MNTRAPERVQQVTAKRRRCFRCAFLLAFPVWATTLVPHMLRAAKAARDKKSKFAQMLEAFAFLPNQLKPLPLAGAALPRREIFDPYLMGYL